ncbi:MAG: hypothetical protein ACRDZ9_06100 [Acidimicrobiales bacterium]
MPWCDECSRFVTTDRLGPRSTCPACGRDLSPPAGGRDAEVRAPWHFKLLVVAVVVYLGWRAVQGVEWVIGRL